MMEAKNAVLGKNYLDIFQKACVEKDGVWDLDGNWLVYKRMDLLLIFFSIGNVHNISWTQYFFNVN